MLTTLTLPCLPPSAPSNGRRRRQGLLLSATAASALLIPLPCKAHRRRCCLVVARAVSAPELRDKPPQPPPPSETPPALRRLLRVLSNLPLALAEMTSLATLSAVGTLIEQNKGVEHYVTNYPLDHAVLGFVTYPLILGLGLDHVYSTWYFWALNALLAASLAACSVTTQLPQLRVARDWRFAPSTRWLSRLAVADVLPNASRVDLAHALASRGYQVFCSSSGRLYGFKGLIGKLAPLGVHAALLLSMAGFLTSALGGTTGSAMVPEGSSFVIGDALRPRNELARLLAPAGSAGVISVDDFHVTYYPNGQVSQYYSEVDVSDVPGSDAPPQRVSMKVNVPLRFRGVTAYQTDWAISSVTVRVGERGAAAVDDAPAFALPMVSLEGKPGFAGRIWGTFVPVPPRAGAPVGGTPAGVTLAARDFQSVAVYGPDGAFVGVRRPGSGKAIVVDDVPLLVERLTGATGLELKSDPGVPLVYAGFGLLIVTSFLSFVSHSQVWAVEDAAGALHVGGKTTKQKRAFEEELRDAMASLPEYADQS